MRTASTKSERIATRVTPEQKTLIAAAAAVNGRSVTEFMVESAQKDARRVLAENRIIRLSAEHQASFAEALLNPQSANDALKAAAQAYDAAGIISR